VVSVRWVLMGLAAASVCGIGAWLVLAKGNTIAPAIDTVSPAAPSAAAVVSAHGDLASTALPRREPVSPPEPSTTPAAVAIDEALQRYVETLISFVPTKVYELLQQRFAVDATGTARLCAFAITQIAGDEQVLLDEPFLSAVFAAWLDATSSPHVVLAATLAAVPADVHGLVERQLLQIAGGLANRDAQLPPQPEGQQRALVHALIAATDHHANRLGTGMLVACALGRAADHDPMAQAALMRFARSTKGPIQEVAWTALAAKLPPSLLLPAIDEPLPPPPGEHDAKRVLAALRSLRNAPDQAAVVHRWLGVRLVDLARQSRYANDPKQDAARVRWLRTIGDNLTADDRVALQAELQVLADGQGELAERARRMLPKR